jgi:hypothetical protein
MVLQTAYSMNLLLLVHLEQALSMELKSRINFQDNNGSNGQVTVGSSDDLSIVRNNTGSGTIIAMTIPFKTQNLMLSGMLNTVDQNSNPFGDSTRTNPIRGGMMSPFLDKGGAGGDPSQSVNPFSFLSNLQIGSTNLVNPDWSIPQSVTMDLKGRMIGGDINNYTQSRPFTDILDLVLTSVIPFMGEENIT